MNKQNASLRWEKNVGVGLNNTRFGPHERKVCIKFVEAKETRKDLERYFPWGKEGDYKEISLSLSSTLIDDDGCAVASRHVTTRTIPRAAFFLLPLFSLSLPLFFVFSIRLFIFVSRRSDVSSIAHIGFVERYAFVCYLKSSRRCCCCCCCCFKTTPRTSSSLSSRTPLASVSSPPPSSP